MRKFQIMTASIALALVTAVWGGDAQKGLDAYNSMDYETALAELQPLAESGDAGGQYGLGMMYGNGFGVSMDDALALKWYGLAADQGHAGAQCNLAVMYQNGWGVAPNEEEAVRYYMLAAEQGVPAAMTALGRHFAMDYSEAYDPVQAYKWFSLAHLLQDMDAGVKRETLAATMTIEQVADGNALVEGWSMDHTELLANQ
jgi:TPR repeat protein